jgi:hypothetical protein
MSAREVEITVLTTLFTTFVAEPLLFAPVKRWWAEVVAAQRQLVEVDVLDRWDKNGWKPVQWGWRDECRAWRRLFIWRWSKKLRDELQPRMPLDRRGPLSI